MTGTTNRKKVKYKKPKSEAIPAKPEEENRITFETGDAHLAPMLTMSDVDAELDFDLSDFQIFNTGSGGFFDESKAQKRILQPRIDVKDISHKVLFESAEKFAQQIDLRENARTFAWVSGNFIFGDIIEALVTTRHMIPREIYICSLSISQENIDSLKNVMLACPELEKLTIVLSGYFYSHEKYSLVPYMYAKVIAIETIMGNTLTIHGSANLRSSNSIEQIMVERGRDLYEFNAAIIDKIASKLAPSTTTPRETNFTESRARRHGRPSRRSAPTTSTQRGGFERQWQADQEAADPAAEAEGADRS